MPWKFVTVLVIVGIVLLFVAFNIGNTTDISFGIYTARDVPVFLSLFIAFFLGFSRYSSLCPLLLIQKDES